MQYIQNFSAVHWAMLVGGVLILIGGMLVLWNKRRGVPRAADRNNGEASGQRRPLLSGVGESTRLVIGVAALIGGYHLAIWAFPPDVNPVQVPRHLWWGLFGGLVLVILGSLWIDRIEASRGKGST